MEKNNRINRAVARLLAPIENIDEEGRVFTSLDEDNLLSSHFEEALLKVMEFEGVYSDNPNDAGGQTFCGISRNFWPDWEHWLYVDDLRESGKLKYRMTMDDFLNNKELESIYEDVQRFYHTHFWETIRGDRLYSPLCYEVFEAGINCGVMNSIKFLQRSLNALNYNAKRGKVPLENDLVVDGIFGDKTKYTIWAIIHGNREQALNAICLWFNVFQGMHYSKIFKNRPSQKVFAFGWTRRLENE